MATTGEPFGLFWDSESGDRTYSAASFEYWLKKFFTSGVFNGDLQVNASSGMTLEIEPGYANVDGKVKFWNGSFTLTLSAANSTYPRIDTIVITRDNVNRQIVCEVVTGTYSGDAPQPTAPVRNSEIYQLVLAQIYVGNGVTEITQSNITDTRMDGNLCGYITGTVEEIDFTQITAQFEAFLEDFEENNYEAFDAWFQEMKDQLSTDAAGHLQNEIDDIQVEINDIDGNVSSLSTSVINKHKVTRFSVSTTSWTTDTTSQSGTTLYKKSIALNHVYVDSPSVDIGSTGVLPTTAQQDAYNLLQYVTVDSAIPCLYLYASDIPTDSFYINVEGCD